MRKPAFVVCASVVAFVSVVVVALISFGDDDQIGFLEFEKSPFGQVILIEDQEVDEITVYLVFPFGEAHNRHEEGLAHYVEHLAWLSAFGVTEKGTGRHSNAWTNLYSTGYWQSDPRSNLSETLFRLIQVAEPISLNDEFALQERNIVLSEYNVRVSERTLYPVIRDIERTIYSNGPLSRSVIGEPNDIRQYSLEKAKQLHADSHFLSSATLVVYGNASEKKLRSLIEMLATDKPSYGSKRSQPIEFSFTTFRDVSVEIVSGASEDTFFYRKIAPLPDCKSPAKCQMLVRLTNGALDSALPGGIAGPLRFDDFVARSFSFGIQQIVGGFVEIHFVAAPDNDVTLETLQNTFVTALGKTLKWGVPADTFERIKGRELAELESIENRAEGNRDSVISSLSTGQPITSISEQIEALENINLKELNAFLIALNKPGREVMRHVRRESHFE